MKETGMVFSAESVNAIFAGKKSQTRRVVAARHLLQARTEDARDIRPICPYGLAASKLWVKEMVDYGKSPSNPHGQVAYLAEVPEGVDALRSRVHPLAPPEAIGWAAQWRRRSPIYMPRWACRLELTVVRVDVQRLHDMTEADAIAEGIYPDNAIKSMSTFTITSASAGKTGIVTAYKGAKNDYYDTARAAYVSHWEKLNGRKAPWSSNPYVWAITFSRVTP